MSFVTQSLVVTLRENPRQMRGGVVFLVSLFIRTCGTHISQTMPLSFLLDGDAFSGAPLV
jgi:hypothetical protein